MGKKKTLVLGASDNPARYSYLAINRLINNQFPVVAVGKKAGIVSGIPILTEKPHFIDIDTITLYLNPANQKEYYDYIISLHPRRIIFNPGTENNELSYFALQKNILTLEACTLVLLTTGQY